MAAWSSRKLLRDVFLRRVVSNQLPGVRCFSSAPEIAPKIGHYSKKGRLFTGTTIGLLIAGGAYVSTVDEATVWKLDETSITSTSSNNEVEHGGNAGPGILGVNLGKNKRSEGAAADYVQGIHTVYLSHIINKIVHPCPTCMLGNLLHAVR